MSQMQVAFIRAHNLIVDRLRADGAPEATCSTRRAAR